MQDTELPKVGSLQKLTLGRDDVLVATCPHPLTTQQAEVLKTRLSDKLGISTAQILVLGDGMELGAIKPPAAAPNVVIQCEQPVADKKFINDIIKGIRSAERMISGQKLL